MNKVTDIQLYHDSFVSLHVQLHNQLRQLILSGHWPKDTRLPSENELTSHLKISRSTIRLALQQIEIEGLIERIPGKGTFVSYQPSLENRNLLIAFVTCDFNDAKAIDLLNGAEHEIRSSPYSIIFKNVENHYEEMEVLTRLQEENVAGALLWPNVGNIRTQQEDTQNYQSLQLPIVYLDRIIEGVEYDLVTSDNYAGAYGLMEHLIELGHEHIIFLSHKQMDILPVKERYRAYKDVMSKHNLIPASPWLIGEESKEPTGNNTLHSSVDSNSPESQQIKDCLLNAPQRPTAIFAINDFIAILAMRVMKYLGIKVPDEISIAGFDDIDLSAHLDVPLTTVAQDSFTIGKHAARLLLDRLEGHCGSINHITIPTQLRVRSSTAIVSKISNLGGGD